MAGEDEQQDAAAFLRLSKLLKGRYSTTKEAKQTLSDVGMLSIGFCCTVLADLAQSKKIGPEDVESVLGALRGTMAKKDVQ